MKAFFQRAPFASNESANNEVASMHNRFPYTSILFAFQPTANPFRLPIMKLKLNEEISSRRNVDAISTGTPREQKEDWII